LLGIRIASMSRPERLFTGLLVVALLGAGWAYYQAQARQEATLTRLTALDTRLMTSNQQRARAAKNRWFSIATIVNKNYNQAADVAVLHQTEDIRNRTKTLLDTLHQLRQSWQAGHRPELGQHTAQLAQYARFINKYSPDEPAQLALTTTSTAVPRPAALALLTMLETQVRQLEARALQTQAEKVGSRCCFCYDRIGAAALPVSKTVAPGAVYQAQLVLGQASSTRHMRFSADGREIPIDPATGQALVQFQVPAARPGQPDTVRAEWHGRVQIPWLAGDTTLETTVPYFIIKPAQR
jgi:hypothetical protein